MFFHDRAETLDFTKRDVHLETGDAEGAGAPALVVKERRTDAKYPLGLFLVVGGVAL